MPRARRSDCQHGVVVHFRDRPGLSCRGGGGVVSAGLGTQLPTVRRFGGEVASSLGPSADVRSRPSGVRPAGACACFRSRLRAAPLAAGAPDSE